MAEPVPYRGRFAPSPTGPLHFGSLVAALGSWLDARASGGEWWLRIEDLDPPREVAGASQRQREALLAFGLEPDAEPVHQSRRGDLYASALGRLLADGHAFACRCTRSDLAVFGGVHRQCVSRPSGRRPAVRLRLPDTPVAFTDRVQGRFSQSLAREVGDVVLRRADGPWAYQLAVVVDDADQGITDVVRGADLLDSTPRQIHLQRCLGLPTPRYAHLPLALDAAGRKLSKSLAALPVQARDPWPALAAAWRFLGQDPAALEARGAPGPALRRAAARFEMARVPAAAARPDVVAG